MFEFLREHQLNIMLVLCGVCGMLAVLLLMTRFLSKSRKWIMVLMEATAFIIPKTCPILLGPIPSPVQAPAQMVFDDVTNG